MGVRREATSCVALRNYHRVFDCRPAVQHRTLVLAQEREDVLCDTVEMVDLTHLTSTSEAFDKSTNNLRVREYTHRRASLESLECGDGGIILSTAHVQFVNVTTLVVVNPHRPDLE